MYVCDNLVLLLTLIADLNLFRHQSWLLLVEKSLSDYFMKLFLSKTMLNTSVIFRYMCTCDVGIEGRVSQ